MHSTQQGQVGVEEGVVIGGGCALLYASQELDGVKVKGDDQKAGVEIVKKLFKPRLDKLQQMLA